MASLDVDKKALMRDLQIREHPMWLQERATVENLVVGLRAIESPGALRDWHAAILEGVLRGERMTADLAQQSGALRESLRSTNALQRRRDASQILQAMFYERDTVRALLSVLRTLGDAVVWRLLQYNRAALAVLGEGRAARHMATSQGLTEEIATLERLWHENEVVAVLADLTTCIRHGDLLCADSWLPRRWSLRECKAGRGGGSRRARQQARLDRLESLLNTGRRPADDHEDELQIVECPVTVRTHHHELEQLLNTARDVGYAASWVDECVLVEAFDQREPRATLMFDAVRAHENALALRAVEETDIVQYSMSVRRIRDRRDRFSTQAPLALLPYAAPITADLCLGGMDVLTTLDCRAVERRFAARGITAHVAQGIDAGILFMHCERGHHMLDVPAPTREQILIEGLSVEFLVDVVDWMLEHPPEQGRRRQKAPRFNEQRVWERIPPTK